MFGSSPAERQQQAAERYASILEGQQSGWSLDFYPSELELGGIAYTAQFADGKATLYLPTGSHKLQSLSIILTNANDSSIFNPTPWYEYDDEKALEVIQKNALFLSEEGMEALQAKIDAGEPVQILALSTCSNEFTDARTILLTLMDP